MRIEDAKNAYSAHLNILQQKKNSLTELLKKNGNNSGGILNFDTVEISRELNEVNAQYEETKKVMDRIMAQEYIAYSGADIKEQAEAASEGAEEFGKILTIYRRIASGGVVPSRDERKLMEFSHELYMAAKTAALLNRQEGEEYDSLWEDEKPTSEPEQTAAEIAADTQIAVPSPEQVAASASADT